MAPEHLSSPEGPGSLANGLDNLIADNEASYHRHTLRIQTARSISHSRDDDDIDFTSDYEMSSASSGFTSLEAATKYHVFENGRYPLPNDESEQNREEIKHSMTKVITGGALGMAPVGDSPQKIIDLGTGSGVWAVEAGDYYPSAHILGVDLSPIQPYFAPPNVEWKIDDLEADWPSAYRNTDYIHGRCFVNTLRNPHKLVVSAYE
ncbi:unnamed protein product [Parascedosporium putredinis]|uniref:TAM domain methyltransferase n=1 Tax=Parascedosporium putredinis TaxID=1442378 RepID=A0A9P1H7X8_9PEZI|nr:unnamed protein product [Parascedosporium putredinis]CAI7998870.1 unnamed protein product [Parascedosporium putredinis]